MVMLFNPTLRRRAVGLPGKGVSSHVAEYAPPDFLVPIFTGPA
jgi:hypothetical protein